MRTKKLLGSIVLSSFCFGANSTTVIYPNGDGGYGIMQLEKATEKVSCELNPIPDDAKIEDTTAKARVIVTSDIGGGDPDDIQSHIHMLTFMDYFNFEGIVIGPPNANHSSGKNHINLNLDAYASDVGKLNQVNSASGAFPSASTLRDMVYLGASFNRKPIKGTHSTAGSQRIIERARCAYHEENNTQPLYVTAWGSKTDIAQALADAPDIAKSIRIVSYGSHNSSGSNNADNKGYGKDEHDWIRDNFPDLYLVDYFGSKRPMTFCEYGENLHTTYNILSGYSNSKLSQRIADVANTDTGSCSKGTINPGDKYLKLGDSITMAFLMNSSSERNNPTSAFWGDYTHKTRNYWELDNEIYDNLDRFFAKWYERFSDINN